VAQNVWLERVASERVAEYQIRWPSTGLKVSVKYSIKYFIDSTDRIGNSAENENNTVGTGPIWRGQLKLISTKCAKPMRLLSNRGHVVK
jgi:hypothetical protein